MIVQTIAAATDQLRVPTIRVPTLDDVVHYVSHGSPDGTYRSECRPARVTSIGGWKTVGVDALPAGEDEQPRRTVHQVWDPLRVTLFVMTPTGLFINECEHDNGGHSLTPGAPAGPSFAGGTWHWAYRDYECIKLVNLECPMASHPDGCRIVATVGYQEWHTTERFAPAAPAEGAGA